MGEAVRRADDEGVERVAPVEAGALGAVGVLRSSVDEIRRPAFVGTGECFAVFVDLVGVNLRLRKPGIVVDGGSGRPAPAPDGSDPGNQVSLSAWAGAIRTPNSTRCPSRRLSASVICERRWRSISFWTKLLGTDSSAKPSTMVRGCTSLSQARCWGVRGRRRVAVFSVEFGDHVVPHGGESESGVIGQRRIPPGSVAGAWPVTTDTTTVCPHSYPQLWTGNSSSFWSVPATACPGRIRTATSHRRSW